MRARLLKPSIFTNEELCELGPYAVLLFQGLWTMADREGRLEFRPKRIHALVLPLFPDVNADSVESLLWQLAARHFILVYEVSEQRYIQITTWKRHQRPHPHESASELPDISAGVPIKSQ